MPTIRASGAQMRWYSLQHVVPMLSSRMRMSQQSADELQLIGW